MIIFQHLYKILGYKKLLMKGSEHQSKRLLNLLKMLKFPIKVYLNYILTCCRFWKFYIPGLFQRCEPFNKKEIGKWWFRQSRKLLFRWSEKKFRKPSLHAMNPYLKWISARLLLEKNPLKNNLDDYSDEMEK